MHTVTHQAHTAQDKVCMGICQSIKNICRQTVNLHFIWLNYNRSHLTESIYKASKGKVPVLLLPAVWSVVPFSADEDRLACVMHAAPRGQSLDATYTILHHMSNTWPCQNNLKQQILHLMLSTSCCKCNLCCCLNMEKKQYKFWTDDAVEILKMKMARINEIWDQLAR